MGLTDDQKKTISRKVEETLTTNVIKTPRSGRAAFCRRKKLSGCDRILVILEMAEEK